MAAIIGCQKAKRNRLRSVTERQTDRHADKQRHTYARVERGWIETETGTEADTDRQKDRARVRDVFGHLYLNCKVQCAYFDIVALSKYVIV